MAESPLSGWKKASKFEQVQPIFLSLHDTQGLQKSDGIYGFLKGAGSNGSVTFTEPFKKKVAPCSFLFVSLFVYFSFFFKEAGITAAGSYQDSNMTEIL